ncbi:Transmembrane protein 65 [Trypanosoma melophagium]|uniref:Transmembrane protein 65 n=1 Tax=Trypanosoma melophagium TaxID=715481 RepID=UPI00351A9016|nr:Transmembrane protein 65 [Trypanosoma melophagium]
MRFFLRCINMSHMACKSLAIKTTATTTTTTTCGISSVAPVDKIVESTLDPLLSTSKSSNSNKRTPSSNSGGRRISTGIGIAVETPQPLTDVSQGNSTTANNKNNTNNNSNSNIDRSNNNSNSGGIHGGTSAEDAAVILDALQRIRLALRQDQMHTKPNTDTNTTNTNNTTINSVKNTNTNSSDSSICMNRDSPLSRDELLISIAALVEKDAEIGPRLLAALSGDALRLLLVICTAQEYFGQDAVETQLRAVDKDCDDNISSQEYDDWVDSTVRQRAAKRVMLPRNNTNNTIISTDINSNSNRTGTGGNSHTSPGGVILTTTTTTTTTIKSTTNNNTTTINTKTTPVGTPIPWRLWHHIAWSAAVPFMAFGFIDNVIFVTVGNTIDQCVARTFGLSTMAAAALGGVVSGTAGIQLHGLAERLAQAPPLTTGERQSPAYHSARRMGSTVGLMLGLLLGMTPLLFLSTSS